MLRGSQPIIICPARSLEGIRIPKEWREGIRQGRMLFLPPSGPTQSHITAAPSEQRNILVAALSDEVYLAYMTPGGKTARLAAEVSGWDIPAKR